MNPFRVAAEQPKIQAELREGELPLVGSVNECREWFKSIDKNSIAFATQKPWTRIAVRVVRLHFSTRTRSAYGEINDVLRDCDCNVETQGYHPADSYVGIRFCRTYADQRTWDEIILLGELRHNQCGRTEDGFLSGGSSSSDYENFHPVIKKSGWRGRMDLGFIRRARQSIPSHHLLKTERVDCLKGREMWALFYRILEGEK